MNLKRAFVIKNTIQELCKYGPKSLFRISNQILLEKVDKSMDTIRKLREAPEVYGI